MNREIYASKFMTLLLLLCVTTAIYGQGGSFQVIGSLNETRQLTTTEAVVLGDGRVLISGGIPGTGNAGAGFARTSAEIFDPVSETWSIVGSMHIARTDHQLTLLTDGRVLITGGNASSLSGAEIYDSAEIYNPTTNSFTLLTNRMNARRSRHVAALLPNGQVLIAGGHDHSGTHPSAELFDPTTNTFVTTGDMIEPRSYFTITHLGMDMLLVAGGTFNLKSELYDTTTGTFLSTGDLHFTRGLPTATLLNDGNVFVAAGSHNGIKDNAEIYNSLTGIFTLVSDLMHTPRHRHSATMLDDGRVLITGGHPGSPNMALQSAEIFDPVTQTFAIVGSINHARYDHITARLPDGRILVAGGAKKAPNPSDGDIAISSSEIFNPESTPPQPQDCIAAYYLFNGNANDESGNGNNLIIGGYPILTHDRNGIANSSYSFDGAIDQLLLTSGLFPSTPNEYTISAWFNSESTKGSHYFLYEASNGIYYRMGIINDILYLSQSPAATGFVNITTPFSNTGTWHHAALTWDGQKIYGYLDGVQIGNAIINSTNIWNLGFSVSGAGQANTSPFKGKIDDIRAYRCALTDMEIKELFEEGSSNQYPIAHASQDSTYECTSPSGTQVQLNASLSSDPDDDPLTYTWRENGNIVAGPTTDPISLVTLSPGSHEIELTVDDGNGGTDLDTVIISIVDTTPPSITLNGDNPLTLECGMPYEEPGATVTDICDNNPTLTISGVVDTSTCGVYTVTYTATDASDNSSVATRTVNVVDTTPPVIMLHGANPLTLIRFSGPYSEPGVIVTDHCDPNPSLVISGSVDTNLPGQYTIIYDASDAKNNTSQITRIVNVIDDPNALEHPFLYLADKKIMLDKMIQSEGDMHSNDEIDIKKGPVTYISNITALGKIDIAKNITIEGDVTAGGELQLDKNVNITGFAQEYANVANISLPSLSFSSSGNDIKVKKNKTQALSPDTYGKIEVEKKATLHLSSGEYFFEELKLKQNVKLEIDLANGPITINVVNKVDMDKDVTMSLEPLGENDSRYVTINSLKDMQIDKGSVLLGTFNAPYGKVQLKKEVYLRGSICSEEIDVDKDVTVLHHDVGNTLAKSITPIFVVGDIKENEELVDEIAALPKTFELFQNYPNPFNPTTTLSFALPEASSVNLKIFNTTGQLVRTLISSEMPAGLHNITWNATDDNGVRVASGMYLYVLRAGQHAAQRKLLLMK